MRYFAIVLVCFLASCSENPVSEPANVNLWIPTSADIWNSPRKTDSTIEISSGTGSVSIKLNDSSPSFQNPIYVLSFPRDFDFSTVDTFQISHSIKINSIDCFGFIGVEYFADSTQTWKQLNNQRADIKTNSMSYDCYNVKQYTQKYFRFRFFIELRTSKPSDKDIILSIESIRLTKS